MGDGRLFAIGGASRSGKTTFTREQVRNERRAFAWDPKREWAALRGWTAINNGVELKRAALSGGPGKYAVVPGAGDARAQFEAFAAACWVWVMHGGGPGAIIADELANVTSPGKAGRNWHRVLSQLLGFGPTIYAISQRWQESDKTAFGNASDIVCFRLSRALDRDYMARELDVAPQRVAELKPLEYLHRNLYTQQLTSGKVRVRGARKP